MPKPKASYPWDYFDEISLTRVKCRICCVEFNKKTSNQQNHLKRHHKILRPGVDKTLSMSTGGGSLNSSAVLANATNNAALNSSNNSSSFVFNLLYEIQKKNAGLHGGHFDCAGSNGMVENMHVGGGSEDMFDDEDEDEEDGDIDELDVDMNNKSCHMMNVVGIRDTAADLKFYNGGAGSNGQTNTSAENSASAFTEENNNEALSSSNEQNITTSYRANEITSNDPDLDYEQSAILNRIYQFNGHLTREVLNFWGYDETDKIVDLHNRRIKSIDTTTFCNFANLVELNLSNNQLKTCEPGLFDGLVSLKHLDLSGNKLKAIRDGEFNDLDSLETLLLDDNQIEYVLKNTFQGLHGLKWLSMSGNRLTFINVKAFTHMKSLVLGEEGEFKLEKNPIDRIRIKDGVVFFY